MARDGADRGVNNQEVGRPSHGSEISGRRFNAMKHQVFRANERKEAEPAMRRKWSPSHANKLLNQNGHRRGGYYDSQLFHSLGLPRNDFASFCSSWKK
jgi:hypothetical protein